MYKYAQIQAKRRKDAQNTCKCGQILANTRRYVQIRANTSRYTHICAKTRKYMKTHPNTHRYTQISCRKDTASSYAQLQGAPFSSVRRHVPASLIMITRFPFTYQTGLSEILSIFIDFWCQFYRIYACFWALDSCIIFSVIFGQFLDPGSIAQMSQN